MPRAASKSAAHSDRDPDPEREGSRIYHEVEFKVIPPHGASGERSVTFTFSGQGKYRRLMELLFSDARTPWKTESDVLRAFVDQGCHYFGEAIGGKIIPGLLHGIDMMNGLVAKAREANDLAESIDQLEREAERMVNGGMRESAVGLVYQYREMAKGLRQFDRIVSRKLVADINSRFAHLLNGAQGRKGNEKPAGMVVDEDERYEGHGEQDE